MEADWAVLPEIVLAKVFSYISTSDRVYMRNVCTSWQTASLRPEAWHSFTFSEEDFFMKALGFDYFSSRVEQLSVDNVEGNVLRDVLISVIKTSGKHFKDVKVFYRSQSSNQIMNTLAEYCTNINNLKVQKLKSNVQVVRNFDSSCKQAVRTIIQRNNKLKTLDLGDIDGYSIFQQKNTLPIGAAHSACLTKLFLIQSLQDCNLGGLMYLVCLKELAIGPHLLSYSLLHHLAGRSLRDLHIVALAKHMEFYNENLQDWQWAEIKKQGPHLRVHCHFGVGHEWTEKGIILKKEMPVQTLIYSKWSLLVFPNLRGPICNYSETLVEFIDFSLSFKSYEVCSTLNYRISVNQSIFEIVYYCKHLRVLAVKEILLSGVILAMFMKNCHLDLLLMENQVEYGFALHSQDLYFNVDEVNHIVDSCDTIEHFKQEYATITGKEWKFYLKHELLDRLFKCHLKFI
ncbi:F-box/LRR-repeat protein 21-like [Mya arenaria]|uniref:F-box/LRR-repeat protein 21-like n=1 Tax=Mya arenaria TaxID=6604 RepID=UPI0022E7F4A0|nr:F-box/LRR-repeat protein 21-like [Mya arenaria]